jgi:hypothetical protein
MHTVYLNKFTHSISIPSLFLPPPPFQTLYGRFHCFSLLNSIHSLFNHSPVKGHLVSFQFLTVVNGTATNIWVQVFVFFFLMELSFNFCGINTQECNYWMACLVFFFFFFVGSGVWTQDFVLCKAVTLLLDPHLPPVHMFSLLRNCHTLFHSGCTIVHSYQQESNPNFSSSPACGIIPFLVLF